MYSSCCVTDSRLFRVAQIDGVHSREYWEWVGRNASIVAQTVMREISMSRIQPGGIEAISLVVFVIADLRSRYHFILVPSKSGCHHR